jgi:hypothetical protein
LDGSWNVYSNSYFEIPLSKNSHVPYSHDPYKMSHLHNFPCPTKYSHYQSRDMCKIPTLSTFPSKPYEPQDMKGNFGKFPHWDTSESSMCVFQELRYIFEDAHRLIQSCCFKSTASNSERLRAAIEQGDMKHTFAKLLYDVEWHAYVLQSILEDSGGPRTTF